MMLIGWCAGIAVAAVFVFQFNLSGWMSALLGFGFSALGALLGNIAERAE